MLTVKPYVYTRDLQVTPAVNDIYVYKKDGFIFVYPYRKIEKKFNIKD